MKTFYEFLEATQWTQQYGTGWQSPASDVHSANKDAEYFSNIDQQLHQQKPRQIPDWFLQKIRQRTGKNVGAESMPVQQEYEQYLMNQYRASGNIVAKNTQQSYGKQLPAKYGGLNPYQY